MVQKLKQKARTAAEYQALDRMMEEMYLSNTRNPHKVLWFGFLRGLAYGLGIFVAGTVLVGLLIWCLNLFDSAPLIGPLIQNIVNSLTFK